MLSLTLSRSVSHAEVRKNRQTIAAPDPVQHGLGRRQSKPLRLHSSQSRRPPPKSRRLPKPAGRRLACSHSLRPGSGRAAGRIPIPTHCLSVTSSVARGKFSPY